MIALTLATLASLSAAPPSRATRWVVDSTRSSIGFSVRRMAVSSIRGRFTAVTGSITHDAANLANAAVNVVILTASLDTDDKERDRRFRGPDFLETQKFPAMRFVSRRVLRQGHAFLAVGDLTVRNVTREVRVPYALHPAADGTLHISGSTRISRKEFDLMWRPNPELANLFVGDQVTIELNLVVLPAPHE